MLQGLSQFDHKVIIKKSMQNLATRDNLSAKLALTGLILDTRSIIDGRPHLWPWHNRPFEGNAVLHEHIQKDDGIQAVPHQAAHVWLCRSQQRLQPALYTLLLVAQPQGGAGHVSRRLEEDNPGKVQQTAHIYHYPRRWRTNSAP